MNDDELRALVTGPESDRVERKESFATDKIKDRVYEAICAFANDYPDHRAPGVVIIGQRDDRTFSNIPIDDRLITELGQIRNNTKILPVPSIGVRRLSIDGHELAAVIVEPSLSPPVRYEGRTWIRTGSTRGIATPEQDIRLSERRRHHAQPFDAQPLAFVPIDDLDRDYFRTTYLPGAIAPDILAANHRELAAQMTALRMQDPSGHPTALGVLLLGVDPTRWIPGAYLQFLRFGGTQPTSTIVDQKEVTGRVVEVIRRTEEILENHIRTPTRFVDVPLEERTPDYPMAALRQLVRNAIMHRAYDGTHAPIRIHWFADRIEIENPGGPFGRINRDNFGKGLTDYRNPNLAAALRDLDFVQRFGRGLHVVAQELEKNGNPPFEAELDTSTTLVRVRSRP